MGLQFKRRREHEGPSDGACATGDELAAVPQVPFTDAYCSPIDAPRRGLGREKGNMMRAIVLALLLLAACSSASRSDDAAELLRTSQTLLDAVTAGDREAFRRTLDPDGLFSDEEGNVRSGAVLVEEVRGLPPGYVGNLRMVDPHTRVRGDAGVVA
jgi:hypothetical protein